MPARAPRSSNLTTHVYGTSLSLVAVAAVTGAVFALKPVAPVLSLGVLYVIAVVGVARLRGLVYAVATSIASMVAFNFFFLPPVHTLALRESENWLALVVYVATAVVVSELSARARRRAREAEQRRREAAFLAQASAALLEADHVHSSLKGIAAGVGDVLGLRGARLELGSVRRPETGETAYDLEAGRRHVGRLFAETGPGDESAGERVLPALASLLAVAGERERLGIAALEAETLRRSDAIKTAVLRSVSHDLRSPLTAIRAATEGLEHADLELDEGDRRELLAAIHAEATRLERLITNLIDLSRLESGAARPQPEFWTIDGLVARALDTLGPGADRVALRAGDPPPTTLVDAAQIERVLVNLFENALKFSAGETPVEVRAEVVAGEVLLRVRDRGPGLRPGELERIFEPFERASAAQGPGTGLGLAIAAGFAQANGGSISAANADGGGAEFILTLPHVQVPARVHA